MDGRKDR